MKAILNKLLNYLILAGLIMIAYHAIFGGKTEITGIKENLKEKNQKADVGIVASKEKEDLIRAEIAVKDQRILELSKKLEKSIEQYEALKKRVSTQTPKNPETFTLLSECKDRYSELAKQFSLCIASREKGEAALNLCLEKGEELQGKITLKDKQLWESVEQFRLTDEKLKNTSKAIDDMDKAYKKEIRKNKIKGYVWGAVIGGALTYILAKKR